MNTPSLLKPDLPVPPAMGLLTLLDRVRPARWVDSFRLRSEGCPGAGQDIQTIRELQEPRDVGPPEEPASRKEPLSCSSMP